MSVYMYNSMTLYLSYFSVGLSSWMGCGDKYRITGIIWPI